MSMTTIRVLLAAVIIGLIFLNVAKYTLGLAVGLAAIGIVAAIVWVRNKIVVK